MKKILLWTLYILGLAAGILCFVFPVQAKEVCDNIMVVLNTPFMIAGVTITLGGLIGLFISRYIMNNTKFGRKELDEIKDKNNVFIEHIDNFRDSVENKVNEIQSNVDNFKSDCNNQVTIMLQQFEDLQSNMLTALEAIPNKKVQSIVAEYKSQYENKKSEIINKTINTNEYIDEKIAEMKAEFDEFMENLKNEKAEDNKTTEE